MAPLDFSQEANPHQQTPNLRIPEASQVRYQESCASFHPISLQQPQRKEIDGVRELDDGEAKTANALNVKGRVQTSPKPSRRFKSFMPGHGGTLASYFGLPEALDNFEDLIVRKNWKRLGTSDSGELRLLDALHESLNSLHFGQPTRVPSVSQMRGLHKVPRYCEIVSASYVRQGWKGQDVLSLLKNMDHDDPLVILELLGQRNQENYALGICSTICDDPPKYNLHVLKCPSTQRPTKIVWLHSRNGKSLMQSGARCYFGPGSRSPSQISIHWAGLGPCNAQQDLSVASATSVSHNDKSSLWMPSSSSSAYNSNETQERAASGSLALVVHPVPTNIHARSETTDQSSRKHPRARQMNSQQGKVVGPIRTAVPATTMLPLDLMSGITSNEILTFYPNHALTWPAITARVLADFGTIAAIVSHVNTYWPAATPDEKLLANTQRYHIKRACQEIFGIGDDEDHWKSTVKTLARRKTFEDNPWYPRGTHNLADLDPAWTLYELGEMFENGDVPSSGPFQDQIVQALRNGPDRKRDTRHLHGSFLGHMNPPSLPLDWKPQFESAFDRQRAKTSQQRQSRENAKRTAREAKLDPQAAKMCAMVNVDPDVVGDPDATISRHYNMIAGEILLWLLDGDGGNLTQQQVQAKLNAEIERRNHVAREAGSYVEIGLVDRSTLAYRKRAALKAQANREGKTYEKKYEEFETLKAGDKNKRRLPTGRAFSLREDGAGSKRRRTRYHPYADLDLNLEHEDLPINAQDGFSQEPTSSMSFDADLYVDANEPYYKAHDYIKNEGSLKRADLWDDQGKQGDANMKSLLTESEQIDILNLQSYKPHDVTVSPALSKGDPDMQHQDSVQGSFYNMLPPQPTTHEADAPNIGVFPAVNDPLAVWGLSNFNYAGMPVAGSDPSPNRTSNSHDVHIPTTTWDGRYQAKPEPWGHLSNGQFPVSLFSLEMDSFSHLASTPSNSQLMIPRTSPSPVLSQPESPSVPAPRESTQPNQNAEYASHSGFDKDHAGLFL